MGLGTHDASHFWLAHWWENFFKGVGGKGMVAVAPREPGTPGQRSLTAGHSSSSGAHEGRDKTLQVPAATRVQARQRGFGAQEAFVPQPS